ncbi:MAG TPA: response regulator transcription factor [Gammaproteobacteria bacterium]|nr:response regulator transcription factor [Gammaproteobacteria bacterium]
MQRALLVEDHEQTREWMAETLEQAFPGIEVGATSDLASARETQAELHFNLAVVDINLPDGSGIDLVRELTIAHADIYCIVATIFDDDAHIFAALKAGAHGYLLKDQNADRIVEQLRGIARGEPPLSPAVARRILRHFQAPEDDQPEVKLSDREREVLTLVAKSYSRGEIAKLLGISVNTAAGYIKTVYQKLNVSTRAEAALEAVRLGLVSFDSH